MSSDGERGLRTPVLSELAYSPEHSAHYGQEVGSDQTPLRAGRSRARGGESVLRSASTEARERRLLSLDPEARPYLIPSLIPAALKERRAWLFWDAESDHPQRKAPHGYNPRTREFHRIDNQDPRHWMPYEDAVEIARTHHMGLGTVLNGDGLVVMDIDAGLPPESRVAQGGLEGDLLRASWDAQMVEVAMYLGSFAERSTSGSGLHIWGTGTLPFEGRNVRPCEIYASGRFMIVTGRWLQPSPIDVRPLDPVRVENIVRRFFARSQPIEGELRRVLGSLSHQEVGQMELEELEALAERQRSPELFRRVALQPGGWRHTVDLETQFPSQSEADFWLMKRLAWATQGQPDHMDRLFRASALMRDKYLARRGAQTYGHALVAKGVVAYEREYADWKARKDADKASAPLEAASS